MKNETNKCRGCPHNKLLEETNWHYCDGDKCEVKIRADERVKVLDKVKNYINSRAYYDNHKVFIDAPSVLSIISEIEDAVEEQK